MSKHEIKTHLYVATRIKKVEKYNSSLSKLYLLTVQIDQTYNKLVSNVTCRQCSLCEMSKNFHLSREQKIINLIRSSIIEFNQLT